MLELVALDFDGVISDSAPESFVVAVRTWCRAMPDSSFHASAPMRSSEIPTPRQITAESVYADFLERMPLGNRAEDYAVVLASLDRGVPLVDQAAYDAFKATFDPRELQAFHRQFYETRHALADGDAAGWLGLMRPYSGVPEMLRARAEGVELTIATAKDGRSVGALLRAYEIDDLFGDGRVLDKETGVNKMAHLEHLRARFGFEYSEMLFIDDKVNHLDSVARLGVRCALAAWGYNSAREHELARRTGYPVLELADLDAELGGVGGGG